MQGFRGSVFLYFISSFYQMTNFIYVLTINIEYFIRITI